MIVRGHQPIAMLLASVESMVQRRGPDHVPDQLLELLDLLRTAELVARHENTPPHLAIRLHTGPESAHTGLVTYQTAARRLGVSTRTISRRVKDGTLPTIGRRIPAAALDQLHRRTA